MAQVFASLADGPQPESQSSRFPRERSGRRKARRQHREGRLPNPEPARAAAMHPAPAARASSEPRPSKARGTPSPKGMLQRTQSDPTSWDDDGGEGGRGTGGVRRGRKAGRGPGARVFFGQGGGGPRGLTHLPRGGYRCRCGLWSEDLLTSPPRRRDVSENIHGVRGQGGALGA